MKLMKRSNIYKASNVEFDPKTKIATSYLWWTFVAEIDGLLVFNNYRYSVSTSKHQRKVRTLLESLGLKIDLELPLPKGLRKFDSIEENILEAEEYLFEREGEEFLKRQERNEKARFRRNSKKLENLLENEKHFRDYEILPAARFGSVSKVAVHQKVDLSSLENDVENALYNFHRDGFGCVVFYV